MNEKVIKGTLVGALFICATALYGMAGLYFGKPIADSPQNHVITFDGGGNPFDYMERYTEQRHRGDTFAIDGVCFSACTLILSEIPADHVCVTPYARLGFHAAFMLDANEKRVFAEEATRILWSTYPQKVREMLKKHGWPGPNVDQPQPIMIEGDELLAIYKACA